MKAAQDKKEEERAKAKMPVGTRLMSEEERVATLEELKVKKSEIASMLFSLPLSLRTDALKHKKTELENKLTEVEKAIDTFSRRVVYVAETPKN